MSGALEGLRVLDFGHYLAGPLVAQMLADHGAAVVRIDPPGGPRWQHAANAMLQRGKRSIIVDLADPVGVATARRLITVADVLVENFRPGVMERLGLGPSEMTALNSRLVYCAIPGFASDDPRASVYAHEGVIGAAAGPYGSRDGDPHETPIFNTLPLASCFGALAAANAIAAALIAREQDGLGQSIEVSMFEAAFELTRYYGDRVPGAPQQRIRLGATTTMALTQHYACKDGRFVHLSWLEGRQLEAFARLTGLYEEWSAAGLLDHARPRGDRAYSQRLRAAIAAVFETRSAAEWMSLANPDADLAECLTTEEWLLYDAQARATRAVITLEDPLLGVTHQGGYPVSMSKTPPRARSARHLLDADRDVFEDWQPHPIQKERPELRESEPRHPLEGVRALDLTQILAGPTACRILAEYGADVVQIVNPHARAGRDFHLSVNNGKRSIQLDLQRPGGMDVFWRLLAQTDVMSTNFSSAVASRLGIDEASVRLRRPDIIYSRISAYGLDGPLQEFRGHDQVGQAVTGMEVRWAGADAQPLMQPHPLNDFGTGQLAAFAIMLALFHRKRTGHGQMVGASLAQTATFLQTPYMVAYRGKNWTDDPGGQECLGFGALERLYRAEDEWLFVAARSVTELKAVEGLGGLQNLDELSAMLGRLPAETWVQRLTRAGIGAHVLRTPQQAMDDAWAISHGVSRNVNFPEAGPGVIVGPSRRLARTPTRLPEPSAPMGWHARELLDEVGLGERLEELVVSGSVVQPSERKAISGARS